MNTEYSVVCLPGRRHAYEHRLVWERQRGPIPAGHHIHHINGDRKDNRIENLELLPSSEHHRLHFLEQGATAEHRARASDNLRGVWQRMPMLTLKCQHCGNVFEKRQHVTKGAAKFCSKRCTSNARYARVKQGVQ